MEVSSKGFFIIGWVIFVLGAIHSATINWNTFVPIAGIGLMIIGIGMKVIFSKSSSSDICIYKCRHRCKDDQTTKDET